MDHLKSVPSSVDFESSYCINKLRVFWLQHIGFLCGGVELRKYVRMRKKSPFQMMAALTSLDSSYYLVCYTYVIFDAG